MKRTSRLAPAVVCLFVLFALPGKSQETATITDEVTVQERSLLVHLPSGIELSPELARLQVGRVDQPISRIEEVELRQTPWNLLIWVDRELVSPSDLAAAATALGRRAAALCDLGFVTVIEAAPLSRTLVSATRSVAVLDKALGDMARGGRLQARQSSPWRFPGTEVARQRMEELPNKLAVYRSNGPQALFLLGGESGASAEDLRSLAGDGAVDVTPWAASVRRLAERLAVDAWTLVGIVLRPASVDRSPPPDPVEQLREQTTGETRFFVDLLHVVSARGNQSKIQSATALEPYLLPRIAPLVTLVRQTGGIMISQDPQIDLALEELQAIERVWFRVTDLALEGLQPLDLEVRDDEGGLVRYPRWVDLGGDAP